MSCKAPPPTPPTVIFPPLASNLVTVSSLLSPQASRKTLNFPYFVSLCITPLRLPTKALGERKLPFSPPLSQMGCFLACFGGDKDQKRRQRIRRSPPKNWVNQTYRPLQANPSPQKLTKEVTDVSLPTPREKNQEQQGSFNSCRKKVTFDLNVKTYEDVSVLEDSAESIEGHEAKKEGKLEESQVKVSPRPTSFPVNHRYQNCENSDDDDDDDLNDYDEDDDDEFEDNELEDEDDDGCVMCTEEESYDSFFSLPIDKERKRDSTQDEAESPMAANVVLKGAARDRSQYVHSVLNPVENLTQWKEVKVRAAPVKTADKEINFQLELVSTPKALNKENKKPETIAEPKELSPEPVFKGVKTPSCSSTEGEISVDASLSTWLVSSENLSNSRCSKSSVSKEEQPILGALTVEDLRHSTSPRRSPSRNPDEIPILGTVGSYWSISDQGI